MKITWHGDRVKRNVAQATMRGIDMTMSQAAAQAKRNHPGWHNRTGKAEGSIGIYEKAHRERSGYVGRWGSRNVVYMLWLEIKHGMALQHAASVIYPRLAGNIKKALE